MSIPGHWKDLEKEKGPRKEAKEQERDIPDVAPCGIESLEQVEMVVDWNDERGNNDKRPAQVGTPYTIRSEPVEKKEQEQDRPEIDMERKTGCKCFDHKEPVMCLWYLTQFSGAIQPPTSRHCRHWSGFPASSSHSTGKSIPSP
jgi:hypothetical protein